MTRPDQPEQTSRVTDSPNSTRLDRACDACQRRKSRCVINLDSASCVMCDFHNQACTFVEGTVPRKQKPANPSNADTPTQQRQSYGSNATTDLIVLRANLAISNSDSQPPRRQPDNSVHDDYTSLHGESLLKKTLGYVLKVFCRTCSEL